MHLESSPWALHHLDHLLNWRPNQLVRLQMIKHGLKMTQDVYNDMQCTSCTSQAKHARMVLQHLSSWALLKLGNVEKALGFLVWGAGATFHLHCTLSCQSRPLAGKSWAGRLSWSSQDLSPLLLWPTAEPCQPQNQLIKYNKHLSSDLVKSHDSHWLTLTNHDQPWLTNVTVTLIG